MGFLELILIAIGLSMDAFAVALCKGLNLRKLRLRDSVVIALFFGGFQGLMPLFGWLLGKQFESYITNIDHWIAFALLALIGGNMIREVFHKEDDAKETEDNLNIKQLLILAIATSIDALAVGITFAFFQVSILPAVSLIAAITFVISLIGVFIGHKFGSKFKSKAELAGGVVLILIGTKILLEHLKIL